MNVTPSSGQDAAAAERAALTLDRGTIVRVVVIAAFLAIALFVLPTIGADWTTTFTSVAIYSIITLGLGILYGRVGLISLGQVALLVIGVWTATRLNFATGLSFPIILLLSGLVTCAIGVLIGTVLGVVSGYYGGIVDSSIKWLVDVALTIPSFLILIVIASMLKNFLSVETVALLLALLAWPGPTRTIRAQVLSLRERGYIQMARLSGASTFDIMFKEMLPNLLPYLAASFSGNVSANILAATGLEALGLGPTRIPTLGMTIFYSIRAASILRGMWWWWGFPILLLIVIFTGLFLISVGLDEIANPRLRGFRAG